jgi:hypothetical protein
MVTGFVRVVPESYRTDAALQKWIERGLAGLPTLGCGCAQETRRRSAMKKT